MRYPPRHGNAGAKLGYPPNVVEADVRCLSCDAVQTEPIETKGPREKALADVVCLFCGRAGLFELVKG